MVGCAREQPSSQDGAPDRLLASVNESPITQAQLDQSLERTFGSDAREVDSETRRKVLESLVTSRAIALQSERELDAAFKQDLERRVSAYREELLVKRFLAKHAPPQPVSKEQIEAYYRQYPQRFGGYTRRRFELLASEGSLSGREREATQR